MMAKLLRKAAAYALGLAEYGYIFVMGIADMIQYLREVPPPVKPTDPTHAAHDDSGVTASEDEIAADIERLRALGARNPESAARAFARAPSQNTGAGVLTFRLGRSHVNPTCRLVLTAKTRVLSLQP